MRKKVASKFGFIEMKNLDTLFIEKGWKQFDEYESFFSNFCSMLENLDGEHSELIIELTKDFIWLRSLDYYLHLKNTLIKLADFKKLDLSTIHIIPLFSKSDREKNKIKSSSLVAYLCQINEFKYNDILKNTKFIIHNDLERLPNPATLKRNNNPIILIDDYIGTGDTALEALNEVLEYKKYDNETLFVASLICQNEGKRVLNEFGYEVISDIFRDKGISEKYSGNELVKMLELMNEIEAILRQDEKFITDYCFGYKASEALVALIRTPNNTFPIYWYSANIGKGNSWNAPFPRN